jgi:hypothetical protein
MCKSNSNRIFISFLFFLLFNACDSKQETFIVINTQLKLEIDNFLLEAKKSQLYRGENMVLSIFPDTTLGYRIVLINEIPIDCHYYVASQSFHSGKIYLFMDSTIIDDNPLVEVMGKQVCEIENEFGLPSNYFSKEYLFKENKLNRVH